eukprot:TRINITY_DN33666_c0_g1_i1.p1 TRINITY_DN33666_c0_g1~~TRINITY_DN33666_c0_g1_i1.p1  ORF type:complete len:590 (-),score=112.90 TRINITY_DN33666_c0_g1_i1:157-1926(-)
MEEAEGEDATDGVDVGSLPTAADVDACVETLRRLRPDDLHAPGFGELRAVGMALFKRDVIKEKFGSSEVVDFLQDRRKSRKTLNALKKVEKQIKKDHEASIAQAETCGMNIARKEMLAKIKSECAAALQAAVCDVRAIDMEEPTKEPIVVAAEAEANGSAVGVAEAPQQSPEDSERVPPRGSFALRCNVCRGNYTERHSFYHQLCKLCAELNLEKREQSADMTGMICVVTGGRVRIGYHTVLRLLRAGAFVLTTTRFPQDCALRFAREPDFERWRERLEVCGPLELSNMRLVERFCDELLHRFPRIHVLINNAAQTLTRAEGWYARMHELENRAAETLPTSGKALLRSPVELRAIAAAPASTTASSRTAPEDLSGPCPSTSSSALVPVMESETREDALWIQAVDLQDFPENSLDESRQPLDLSSVNSWSRRLGQISTLELLQTLAANAAAPFVMCSRLMGALAPVHDADSYGHIINVSALEGKFSVKNKGSGHPHTNMAKAGLNMLTRTSASTMAQRRILMNCVDTGWVTDMAPGGVGIVAATHATHVGPPLDEEDGAARVLDPIFQHLKDPSWLVHGVFFKNYFSAGW